MHDSLVLDRVTRHYKQVRALDALSMTVGGGELFGFVGGNGAGKTTAMRIVLGVLAADSGTVYWRGRPLDLAARRRIGYMPEERGLYPKMGAREQLVHFARLHGVDPAGARRRADHWLERFGLADRARDEVANLSLGNQQRVQLAAALVHDPVLLVLDEPFSGLDPAAVDEMSAVLRERAAEGAPVLFSSHHLELVERLCDRIGIIKEGALVAEGTVEELRSGGPRRYAVRVEPGEAQGNWVERVPGARAVGDDQGAVIVELPGGTDDQDLLRAALAAGPVRSFTPHLPRLAELYRETVEPVRGGSAADTADAAPAAERSAV
ncbi:ABC transporter ATP-binding protein [Streptomonospora litoralis]|uniref:Putative ABC transporter ATP-binding protein YxlF n=1 Tax=Streptomonospora litoralis TaxID=2498135 RepID=A0A4P6QBA0_9ACTN|nr:ATP-binding cassette domain-containing protein [Streptomonospora litoralis]QBI56677.1 putative ABC transporter ATP-binding protein YxlF [Streptomonospora litoralis]